MKLIYLISSLFMGMTVQAGDTTSVVVPQEIKFKMKTSTGPSRATAEPDQLDFVWGNGDKNIIFSEGKQLKAQMSGESIFTAYSGGSSVYKKRETPNNRCELTRVTKQADGSLKPTFPETDTWLRDGTLSFVKTLPLPQYSDNGITVYQKRMVMHALYQSSGFVSMIPPVKPEDSWVELSCFQTVGVFGSDEDPKSSFETAFGGLVETPIWSTISQDQIDHSSAQVSQGQAPVLRNEVTSSGESGASAQKANHK